jgi:membrane-bound lytic murein transglycosylase D
MDKRNRVRRVMVYCFLALLTCSAPAAAERQQNGPDPFPVFDAIESNVAFWKKIYSEYDSDQGVLHDSQQLNIIYDVIDLISPDAPGAEKINRQRIKTAKEHYTRILQALARGEAEPAAESQRVADLFGSDAEPAEFRSAARNIRCQVGQRDRFRMGVIRSGAYIDRIIEIFRSYHLPEDLAYLPHVESSYNPEAYSKFGAAGIWQFTRSTGKRYMTVGYEVDERRDPIRSTHAAARLLQKNYERLNDWPMAVTAYNHGAAGMLRAQKKMGGYEAIFKDYRSRIFKFASRNFYSEFLAARDVARDYRRYFGDLDLHAPAETTEVVLTGYAHLPELADLLALDLQVLQRFNPALRKPVIEGRKLVPRGYRLRLPADADRNWEGLLAELAPRTFKDEQNHSRFYTVRRGDTAGDIARMHGISLPDLIAVNQLDARATIYIDQNLRIPAEIETIVRTEGRTPVPDGEKVLEKAPPVLLAANQSDPVRERAPDNAFSAEPPGNGSTPPVVENETVTDASRVSTEPPATPPASEDAAEGGGTGSSPSAASTLPVAAAIAPVPPESDRSPETPDGEPVLTGHFSVDRVDVRNGRPVGIIRVEVEETIGHYAEWLGVRAADIRRLNGMRYGQYIHLGQPLRIPLHRVTKEAFQEKRIEYHKELMEDFFAAYRIEGVQVYAIKKGDNIWTLAREEFDVPLWLIRRYNTEVDFRSLAPAQALRVPVVEKIG